MPLDHSADNGIATSRPENSEVGGTETFPFRYCVITAVRDEEQFIGSTIESMVSQIVKPLEWVIVDDGSKDGSAKIVESYLAQNSWIRLIRRVDRGQRAKGGGVEAFLEAYSTLRSKDWDFLVNLDGDMTFSADYFQKCFEQFREEPALGIGGGDVYAKMDGNWRPEQPAAYHVRGAAKIYRRQCWDALGGLWPGLGWDTIDEVKANYLGWRTQSFKTIQLFHHRLSGNRWGGWQFSVMDGEADYVVNYLPLFFFLKCIRYIFCAPFVVRSVGMMYGYLRGFLRGAPRMEERELVAYLRGQQWRRLFGLSSIWK